MTFDEYYNLQFRSDLAAVLSAGWRGHETHGDPAETIVQPRTVSAENPVIGRMVRHTRALFAVALYATILVDQVVFTRLPDHYPRFRELTVYPKLRGDCPGGCSWMLSPDVVLRVVGMPTGPSPAVIDQQVLVALREARATLKSEVDGFVRDHMPELEARNLWSLCEGEYPLNGMAL